MVSNRTLTINAIACVILFAMLVIAHGRTDEATPQMDKIHKTASIQLAK